MNISDAGLQFIIAHEGMRLTAYPDPATGGKPITIGVGHTGPEVHLGMTITEAEALELLREDCKTAEKCLAEHCPGELTQNQWDSLVSFIYNVGCGNFKSSTLARLINSGDMEGAAREFARWNKANKKVMAGLTTRRAHEAQLFQA